MPPNVAVMVTLAGLFVPTITVNVAEVEPTGMVTEDGTVTAEELEERVTVTPGGGAGPDSSTVP